MISDLLPNLAELADDLCFIHSMTAKLTPTARRRIRWDGLHREFRRRSWVQLLGTENQNSARVRRHSRSARRSAGRPEPLEFRVPAARLSGHCVQCRQTNPQSRHAGKTISPAAEAGTRDFLKFLNDRHLARHPGDSELLARISSYELAAKITQRCRNR